MNGKYQVWHPTKPDARYPEDYRRVAAVEASSLGDAAGKGGRPAQPYDVIIDPALVAHRSDGKGEFSALPLFRDYDKFPELREIEGQHDKAWASAVLEVESPTPEQIDKIISTQHMVYSAQQEDRSTMEGYEDEVRLDEDDRHGPSDYDRMLDEAAEQGKFRQKDQDRGIDR